MGGKTRWARGNKRGRKEGGTKGICTQMDGRQEGTKVDRRDKTDGRIREAEREGGKGKKERMKGKQIKERRNDVRDI